jgi:hypothetical protein
MRQFLVSYAFWIAIGLLVLSIVVWFWIDRSKIAEKGAAILSTFAGSFLGIAFGFLVQNYREEKQIEDFDEFFAAYNVDISAIEYANFAEAIKSHLRSAQNSDSVLVLVYSYFVRMRLSDLDVSEILKIEPFRTISLETQVLDLYYYGGNIF